MTLNQSKAQLSEAYATAIASAARCSTRKTAIDDDSVDLTLVSTRNGLYRHKPELHLQLKATAQNVVGATHVDFDLPLKNYEDLRDPMVLVPKILVVMVLPDNPADWLRQAEHRTRVYRCAYWLSLVDLPEVSNSTTVRVHLPRSQMFTPAALNTIMDSIANGGNP